MAHKCPIYREQAQAIFLKFRPIGDPYEPFVHIERKVDIVHLPGSVLLAGRRSFLAGALPAAAMKDKGSLHD